MPHHHKETIMSQVKIDLGQHRQICIVDLKFGGTCFFGCFLVIFDSESPSIGSSLEFDLHLFLPYKLLSLLRPFLHGQDLANSLENC